MDFIHGFYNNTNNNRTIIEEKYYFIAWHNKRFLTYDFSQTYYANLNSPV